MDNQKQTDVRADAEFLRASDMDHVGRFKHRDYACIIEQQEIAAVVRYIARLEARVSTVAPAAVAPSDESTAYEAWLRKERGRRCDFNSNAGSWARAAWHGRASAEQAAMTDEQIIERCKAAGIKWIPPELPDDVDYETGFPGSFDMVSMDEMRAVLAAPTPTVAADAAAASAFLSLGEFDPDHPLLAKAAQPDERAAAPSEERSDALCDAHYSRGLQAGFSLGQMDDNEGLRKALESREGYLKVLHETSSAAPQAALTDEQRATVTEAANVIAILTGHDSFANLKHKFGDDPWTSVNKIASDLRALIATAPTERMSDAAREEEPSWTNPLTPYGMLVRALRIAAGATLMDMANFLGSGPAALSSLEFGRKPVTNADIVDAAHYFASFGIHSTTHALTIAARKAEIERSGGQS